MACFCLSISSVRRWLSVNCHCLSVNRRWLSVNFASFNIFLQFEMLFVRQRFDDKERRTKGKVHETIQYNCCDFLVKVTHGTF